MFTQQDHCHPCHTRWGETTRTLTTAGLAPAFASLTFRENEQLQSTC